MRQIAVLPLTLLLAGFPAAAESVSSVTSNGITWTFAEPVESGTFFTGDPWVIGPVTVTGISNSLNDPSFTPRPGQNGSMVNPLVGHGRGKQGYDDGIGSYDAAVNAGRPNGRPVAPDNPLVLEPGSSLVSMTSWLYRGKNDAEPGAPGFNAGTGTPRPTTRTAGILTVLAEEPPANAFRPPYAGADKTVRFTRDDVDLSRLKNLPPPSGEVPDPARLAERFSRPWVDHGFEFIGGYIHPSEHMPNYGRDMAHLLADSFLVVNLDMSQLPGDPDKAPLVYNLVQFGIDLTGIADSGGGWRANGGHGLGRKLPILFAGLMLDDAHMLGAGQWDRTFDQGVEFQEDQNTFYVDEAAVALTNSDDWNPDSRNVKRGQAEPYRREDIGMAEWGIRHGYKPDQDNRHPDAVYRDINGGVYIGTALAAQLMGLRDEWNHEAFFDYAKRFHDELGGAKARGTNAASDFAKAMWARYSEVGGR